MSMCLQQLFSYLLPKMSLAGEESLSWTWLLTLFPLDQSSFLFRHTLLMHFLRCKKKNTDSWNVRDCFSILKPRQTLFLGVNSNMGDIENYIRFTKYICIPLEIHVHIPKLH